MIINGRNLSEANIQRMIDDGAKRWTKYEEDRLYLSHEALGLVVERYNTGNIFSAKWQGEHISNTYATELDAVNLWLNLKNGKIGAKVDLNNRRALYARVDEMREAANEYVDSITKVEEA